MHRKYKCTSNEYKPNLTIKEHVGLIDVKHFGFAFTSMRSGKSRTFGPIKYAMFHQTNGIAKVAPQADCCQVPGFKSDVYFCLVSGQLTISVGEQSKVTIGRGFAKVPKGSCFELNNPGRHSAIVCFFLATT